MPALTQVFLLSKAEAYTDFVAGRYFMALLIQNNKVFLFYLANAGQAASKS